MSAPPELWAVVNEHGVEALTQGRATERTDRVVRYTIATPLTDAAGEMLEALRAVRGYLDDDGKADTYTFQLISRTIARATGRSAMTELHPCPCGKVPDELVVVPGHTEKYAFTVGTCCGDWHIEFRTGYFHHESSECLALARAAWNEAGRKEEQP